MSYQLQGSLFSDEDLTTARGILQEQDLNIVQLASVEDRVIKAATLWLRQDLGCDDIMVEREFQVGPAKGIIDLALRSGDRCWLVDWKTTGSVKRPHYTADITAEFQTSVYLAYAGDYIEEMWGIRPEFIEYRCIDEDEEVLSFRVHSSEATRKDAASQLHSLTASFNGLAALPVEQPWPRNRPKACFVGSKNGRPTCAFWDDCTNMTMPPTPVDVNFNEHIPRSKSAMKAFIECPERFRRERLFPNIRIDSDAIRVGVAFHLLAAHLWERAWKNVKGEQK